jgi:hypothetical protein
MAAGTCQQPDMVVFNLNLWFWFRISWYSKTDEKPWFAMDWQDSGESNRQNVTVLFSSPFVFITLYHHTDVTPKHTTIHTSYAPHKNTTRI